MTSGQITDGKECAANAFLWKKFSLLKGGLRSLRLGFQKYFYGINSMSYDKQKSVTYG
jgi:hypothetical protein